MAEMKTCEACGRSFPVWTFGDEKCEECVYRNKSGLPEHPLATKRKEAAIAAAKAALAAEKAAKAEKKEKAKQQKAAEPKKKFGRRRRQPSA